MPKAAVFGQTPLRRLIHPHRIHPRPDRQRRDHLPAHLTYLVIATTITYCMTGLNAEGNAVYNIKINSIYILKGQQ